MRGQSWRSDRNAAGPRGAPTHALPEAQTRHGGMQPWQRTLNQPGLGVPTADTPPRGRLSPPPYPAHALVPHAALVVVQFVDDILALRLTRALALVTVAPHVGMRAWFAFMPAS